MKTHISKEQLLNFVDKNLNSDETKSVQDHITKCSFCMAEVDDYRKIVNLMLADKSDDAPADSIIWAKNLYRTKQFNDKKSFTQKIFAVLKMDLSQNQPVFGERSSASSIRQMLYQTKDNSLDLRISKVEKGIELVGQILGDNFEKASVELTNLENAISTVTNELSEFRFLEIIPGTYDLSVKNKGKEIIIENLDLH